MPSGTIRMALKVEIVKSGIPQHEVARRIGRTETWLSRLVHGRVDPTPQDRSKLSEVLGQSEVELFGAEGLSG